MPGVCIVDGPGVWNERRTMRGENSFLVTRCLLFDAGKFNGDIPPYGLSRTVQQPTKE